MLEWGPLPFTLGHEIGGHLDDGTPVTVWPLVPCGECDRCLAGEPQQCRTGTSRIYGVGPEGGMADRILVDPRNVVTLPDGLAERTPAWWSRLRARCTHCAARASPRATGWRSSAPAASGSELSRSRVFLTAGGCRSAARPQRAARPRSEPGEPPRRTEYDVVVDAAGTSGSIARSLRAVTSRRHHGHRLEPVGTRGIPDVLRLEGADDRDRQHARAGHERRRGARPTCRSRRDCWPRCPRSPPR